MSSGAWKELSERAVNLYSMITAELERPLAFATVVTLAVAYRRGQGSLAVLYPGTRVEDLRVHLRGLACPASW